MTKEQAFDMVFTKAPDYADIMPVDKFITLVEAEWFNNYDGMGYMAVEIDNEFYECPSVYCSVPWLKGMKDRGWTHVCWYNK